MFGFMLIYTLLLNSQEIRRLYHLNFIFEEKNITQNFRSLSDFFPNKTVLAKNHSAAIVSDMTSENTINTSATNYLIPQTFPYNSFDVSTEYFLRYTGTDALLVLKDNQLIHETYYNDFQSDDVHITWSISKSIVSLLLSIAIEEGVIESLDDLAMDYYPELESTAYKNVSLNDLLQMTSGVQFDEDYADPFSDVNIFSYYLALRLSIHDYIQRLQVNDHSGKHQYASIDTQVLSQVLSRALKQDLSQYLSNRIWSKAGMQNNAKWISDGANDEFSAGGLSMTARDLSAIGVLLAKQGQFQGKQIIPQAWLAKIGNIEHTVSHEKYTQYNYSRSWWIPKDTQEQEMLGLGIYDQYLYVNRAKNIVIVKLSANANYVKDDYVSEKQSLALFRAIVKDLE